jgi:DHA1 family tetracycline resistance protein-like MFS transporter
VLIIYLILFVSMIGVGIIVPLFPFFGEQVGASAEVITSLMAVFAIGQLISTPLWGWLSDRIGRKPVFLLSLVGGGVSYVLLAFADTIILLLWSRLIGGLMTGVAGVAFAAITDLTEPGPERAKGLGRIGASMAFGFMIGPALGGLLAGSEVATADYTMIALVAGTMDVFALLLAAVTLKETLPKFARSQATIGGGGNWRRPLLLLGHRPMLLFGGANLLFSGSFAIVDSTFPLFSNRAHGLTPQEIGYLFTFMATLTGIAQATCVGRLVKAIGDQNAVLLGIAGYFVAFWVIVLAPGFYTLGLGMSILSLSWACFLAPASNLVAAMAEPQERGLALGLFQAMGNVGRSLTPLFSGLLFAGVGMSSPFVLAALLMIPAFALAFVAKPAPFPAINRS